MQAVTSLALHFRAKQQYHRIAFQLEGYTTLRGSVGVRTLAEQVERDDSAISGPVHPAFVDCDSLVHEHDQDLTVMGVVWTDKAVSEIESLNLDDFVLQLLDCR